MLVKFKVYRLSDGVKSIEVDAPSIAEARIGIERQGYSVVSERRKFQWPFLVGQRSRFSAVLFSQELLALLEAGLNLVEAIEILGRKSKNIEVKRVLDHISRQLREGLSFSRAMELNTRKFSPLYIAIIRTSERTGDLIEALRRYLEYTRQINQVRDKVISASVYPLLLISLGFLVILFLMAYVVPRFSRVYEDIGENLPLMSRLLMNWGQFFDKNAVSFLVGVPVVCVISLYALSRQSTLSAIGRKFWSLPVIGEKFKLYQLARLTRTLSMLLNSGVPFVTALDMVDGLLRQAAVRQALVLAKQSIREGKSVSDVFAANGLATEVGVRLLIVGERSGKLAVSMERIAKLYEEEVARWLDWFSRLFEPVLMMGIGLIIGIIVILMYLPIFELAGSLQ